MSVPEGVVKKEEFEDFCQRSESRWAQIEQKQSDILCKLDELTISQESVEESHESGHSGAGGHINLDHNYTSRNHVPSPPGPSIQDTVDAASRSLQAEYETIARSVQSVQLP